MWLREIRSCAWYLATIRGSSIKGRVCYTGTQACMRGLSFNSLSIYLHIYNTRYLQEFPDFLLTTFILKIRKISFHQPLYQVHLPSTGFDPFLPSEQPYLKRCWQHLQSLVHIEIIVSCRRCSFVRCTSRNLLLCNFREFIQIVASVSCSYLTGAAPGVVICCCGPSAFKVQQLRCTSSYFV